MDSLLNVSNKTKQKRKNGKKVAKIRQELSKKASKRAWAGGDFCRPPTYFLIASNLYYSTLLIKRNGVSTCAFERSA